MGGALGLGGEGQRLQLLPVGGAVSAVAVGRVCVLGVCGGWAGGRRQRRGGGCWGVQGGGGAGLRQVGVSEMGHGVWVCQLRPCV